MNPGRCGLIPVYVLATLMAQGFHVHEEWDGDARDDDRVVCGEPRTHAESRPAPGSHASPDDCLACQYRAQHYCWSALPPSHLPAGVDLVASPIDALSLPGARLRASCRAPPRA